MIPTCSNCKYWHTPDELDKRHGMCRRMPPQVSVVVVPPRKGMGGEEFVLQQLNHFPATDHDRWCGEWRTRMTVVKSGEKT